MFGLTNSAAACFEYFLGIADNFCGIPNDMATVRDPNGVAIVFLGLLMRRLRDDERIGSVENTRALGPCESGLNSATHSSHYTETES